LASLFIYYYLKKFIAQSRLDPNESLVADVAALFELFPSRWWRDPTSVRIAPQGSWSPVTGGCGTTPSAPSVHAAGKTAYCVQIAGEGIFSAGDGFSEDNKLIATHDAEFLSFVLDLTDAIPLPAIHSLAAETVLDGTKFGSSDDDSLLPTFHPALNGLQDSDRRQIGVAFRALPHLAAAGRGLDLVRLAGSPTLLAGAAAARRTDAFAAVLCQILTSPTPVPSSMEGGGSAAEAVLESLHRFIAGRLARLVPAAHDGADLHRLVAHAMASDPALHPFARCMGEARCLSIEGVGWVGDRGWKTFFWTAFQFLNCKTLTKINQQQCALDIAGRNQRTWRRPS
jgi:hypothetical protein